MIRSKICSIFLCAFLILSCSKDAVQDTPENAASTIRTGKFIDSPVEGLYYETSSMSGYTNSKGEFQYKAGEEVSFFVGETRLGVAQGQPVITPISIAKTPNASIYSPEVQYIAAFLQTLDLDGNPANGIKLDQNVVAAAGDRTIPTIPSRDRVREIILDVVKKVKEKTGVDLVEQMPDEAASHLAETLGEKYNMYVSLIPAIESWVAHQEPKTATEWVHEYSEGGNLIRSTRFEKHPRRISAVYTYSDFDADGYPLKIEVSRYSFGEEAYTSSRGILYDEAHDVNGFQYYNQQGEVTSANIFTSKDVDGFITEQKTVGPNGEFYYREIYNLDENKNNTSKIRFASETETDITKATFYFQFTYTDSGELNSVQFVRPYNLSRITNYYYSADSILERTFTRSLDIPAERMTTTETIFNNEEERVKLIITQGEWRSEYLEYFDDGHYKVVYTYYQNWLQEEVTVGEDRIEKWLIRDIDRSGSYRIEYKNPDLSIIKTEYYDDYGNLIEA